MDYQILEEVIACLDKDRRLVHYFKDKYAVYLMAQMLSAQGPCRIADVRNGQFAKLLNRPCIQSALRLFGDGMINSERLNNIFADEFQSFVITLSSWGDNSDYYWSQTSRPGSNLVLQLNLTNEHDVMMKGYDVKGDSFKCYGHPVHVFRNSLAWSRIDFDLDEGVALIEEIQTDWIRKAKRHYEIATAYERLGYETYRYGQTCFNTKEMASYTKRILSAYGKNWDEVMLFYTLVFIREELGLKSIYYHDFKTGCVIKNIIGNKPPISLYSDLPKKFCFELTDELPRFLAMNKKTKRRLKRARNASWHRLDLA